METANKRLVSGTVTYMIGNMSSKILQMLVLPIITAAVSTSDYGYYDLIITTISLVIPLVTLQIIEGMFRDLFSEDEIEKKKAISTVTAFLLAGFIFLGASILLISNLIPSFKYPILIFLCYVSVIIFNFMQKLARSNGYNKPYAISGVIHTATMLVLQVFTLWILNIGLSGLLIANSLSLLISSIYLNNYVKLRRWITIKAVDKSKLYELLKFSAPLVPNSLGWWMISSVNSYIIVLFINAAANGIFSIAGKFSQLIAFATNVFQLAWQESAIIEEKSSERDRFYSNTFNAYMKILMCAYLIIAPLIRIIIPVLLDSSYQIGYLYSPFLLIGSIFGAFSQFYGSAYYVFKKTGGAFQTTIIAAFVNLLISVGLVKWIGLFAPVLGTAMAFLVQWIVRVYQMKNYFRVDIDIKTFLSLSILMIIVTGLYYVNNNFLQLGLVLIGVIIFFFYNNKLLRLALYKIISKR